MDFHGHLCNLEREFQRRSYKDIMNFPGSNKAEIKVPRNERYFSLKSQEAVKKKNISFPQWAAITLMNAQHVNLLTENTRSYFLTKCREQNRPDDKKLKKGQKWGDCGSTF